MIDEKRVVELRKKLIELREKRKPIATEYAKLWAEKNEKIKRIKELSPKQAIVERAEDPSNPERPYYYYIVGYKDELTEERKIEIAKLEKEIESIEKEMEKIRQKLHEIDNEEKKLIVENKDLISPIIDFFKNTKEGERILYTEDPYDGFFGGEGLSESTAVILYAEYKILKTKKVRW